MPPFHPDSLPDLTGKVYIVTGATSGIGFHTAARLAQHGAHVYLCARSAAKGAAAIQRVQELYLQAKNVTCLKMDHLSLKSVLAAAKWFAARETALHGLINNAGVMATPFSMTPDGYEGQWQTNYLAHWVLTEQLLPLLLKTSQSLPPRSVRIINLSSVGHRSAPSDGIHLEDTSLPNDSAMRRYAQSKLANILHIRTLNRLYGPGSDSAKNARGQIWTAIVHPGLVRTNLSESGTEIPGWMKAMAAVAGMTGLSANADEGAWMTLKCAADPGVTDGESGGYFIRAAAEPVGESRQAKDAGLAEKLDRWTKEEMKKGGWSE